MPPKKLLSPFNRAYRYLPLLFITLSCALTVKSQNSSRIELYGGYSYLNKGMHGLNGEFTYNLNDYLGITLDASGTIKSNIFKYSLMIGPEYRFLDNNPYTSFGVSKLVPFAHILFGASRTRTEKTNVRGAKYYTHDNSVTVAAGGGLDYKLAKIVSIRFTGDYLLSILNNSNSSLHSFRVGTGLVLMLGER